MDEFEKLIHVSGDRNVAKPVRMALGSLIIRSAVGTPIRSCAASYRKSTCNTIGLKEYQRLRHLPVALVKFRKQFKNDRLERINERIARALAEVRTKNPLKPRKY